MIAHALTQQQPNFNLARARELWRKGGVNAVIKDLLRLMRGQLLDASDGVRHALSSQQAGARLFDTTYGTDTRGTRMAALRVPAHLRKSAVDHVPSRLEEFEAGMRALPVEPNDYTFIDLGSGKGRAVMLAAQRSFKRVMGVELSEKLHRVAKENVSRLPSQARVCQDIELICGDASAVELPNEPLVIYLYHPFHADVMRPVAQHAAASYAAQPRPMYVLYLNPFHASEWIAAGFHVTERAANYMVLQAQPLG